MLLREEMLFCSSVGCQPHHKLIIPIIADQVCAAEITKHEGFSS